MEKTKGRVKDGGKFSMTLEVPPNCRAVVTLPSELQDTQDKGHRVVGSGVHSLECEIRL